MIFIYMDKPFQQYLSRRMMGPGGWHHFCVACGMYHHESKFAKLVNGVWGLKSSCRIHQRRTRPHIDKDMEYLKLNPLCEQDFIDTQKALMKMGYTYGEGKTVHEQFMEKYGDKIKRKVIDPFDENGNLKKK